MDNQDRLIFSGKLTALAISTGRYQGLEKPEIKVYWDGLKDIPRDVIVTALDEALKVYEHFPAVAEIRHLCDEVNEFVLKTQKQLPEGRVDPHERLYRCMKCLDTCWHHGVICKIGDRCGIKSCLEKGDDQHVEHSYSVHCTCWPNNPVYNAPFNERKKFYSDKRLGRKGYD